LKKKDETHTAAAKEATKTIEDLGKKIMEMQSGGVQAEHIGDHVVTNVNCNIGGKSKVRIPAASKAVKATAQKKVKFPLPVQSQEQDVDRSCDSISFQEEDVYNESTQRGHHDRGTKRGRMDPDQEINPSFKRKQQVHRGADGRHNSASSQNGQSRNNQSTHFDDDQDEYPSNRNYNFDEDQDDNQGRGRSSTSSQNGQSRNQSTHFGDNQGRRSSASSQNSQSRNNQNRQPYNR
jgi:hypothetical protein